MALAAVFLDSCTEGNVPLTDLMVCCLGCESYGGSLLREGHWKALATVFFIRALKLKVEQATGLLSTGACGRSLMEAVLRRNR